MAFSQGLLTWLLSWWLGRGPTPPPPAPPPVVPPPPMTAAEMAVRVVFLTNLQRLSKGLPQYTINDSLTAAAQRHAELMAARDELSHQFPGEPSPAERDRQAGYAWSREGENAAAGQRSPAEVVADWMRDPAHRANMLGPYVDVGVGMATDARGIPYWNMDFGAPA